LSVPSSMMLSLWSVEMTPVPSLMRPTSVVMLVTPKSLISSSKPRVLVTVTLTLVQRGSMAQDIHSISSVRLN
jgi:hypothetical protein